MNRPGNGRRKLPSTGEISRASPEDIRAQGWFVAVHNDYVLNGDRMTFWLFTNPATGRFVRGEGSTDADALDAVRAAIKRAPSAILVDDFAAAVKFYDL